MTEFGQIVVIPEAEEQSNYRQLEHVLAQPAPRFVGTAGETAEIPPTLLQMLRDLMHRLATDHVAVLTTTRKVLATQQAAAILGISRPTLVRLLEVERAIPFARVGTHRRIRYADLLAYRHRIYLQQRHDMAELTALGEEMGGYDVPVEQEFVMSRPPH